MTSKYPITVERLPVFVLLGHSNADGWCGTEDLFALYDYLLPGTTQPIVNPEDAWYRNVYVFTSEHPFPTFLGTPVTTVIEDGEWLELNVAFADSPAAAHPFPSPFSYPNNAGGCYPHWFYKAYDDALLQGNNGVRFGVELPFQWLWKNHWGRQVGFVKLAFGSSFFLPVEDSSAATNQWLNPYSWSPSDSNWKHGTIDTASGQDHISWWTPADAFDFAPSSGRFFQRWLDKMAGAQAALPSGTKMDVQLIIPWMGDNDSLARLLPALENFKPFVKEFCRRARQACVDNDWTTLAQEQIPIVWPGIFGNYDNGQNSPIVTTDLLNGVLQEVADEDQYFRVIDTNGFTVMVQEGQSSAIATYNHFGAQGYVDASQAIYDAWVEMQAEVFDAISEDDRVTWGTVKDRIRTYYNRSRTNTDIDDETALIHVNGAMNRILNDVGDNAYWLRRRNQLTLDIGPGAVTTMPKFVTRVLKIEDSRDPRYGLKFQQIGFADGGKLQIQLEECGTSSSTSENTAGYVIHYITRPRDLSADAQLVPLPRTIIEWLVVETVRRLARSGSNVLLQGSMELEARDLRERCLKELQVMQRAKKDRLHTVRRWPTLRYRRGN